MQIVLVCNTLFSQQGAPVNRHHHHHQGHKAVTAVVCQSVPLISTQSNNTGL